MKRNLIPTLLIVTGLVLGFGLIFSGLGPNQVQDGTAELLDENGNPTESAGPAETVDATTEFLESLEPRVPTEEELLQARLDELEQRMEEVVNREIAVEEREAELNEPTPEEPTFEQEFEIPAMDPPVEREPRTRMVRLPAATELLVELTDPLSSEFNMVGDTVRGVVAEDVVRRQLVAIPAGSEITGTVVDVISDRKIGGQARLAVRFDEVRTPAGYQIGIQSFLETEGRNQRRRDAATIGGSAAGGAILGRILKDDDRTKGALIGGVLGAAIGAAVASENRGDPAMLEAGSLNTIALDLPVHVAVLETEETLLARK
jgi:hypothetical protein